MRNPLPTSAHHRRPEGPIEETAHLSDRHPGGPRRAINGIVVSGIDDDEAFRPAPADTRLGPTRPVAGAQQESLEHAVLIVHIFYEGFGGARLDLEVITGESTAHEEAASDQSGPVADEHAPLADYLPLRGANGREHQARVGEARRSDVWASTGAERRPDNGSPEHFHDRPRPVAVGARRRTTLLIALLAILATIVALGSPFTSSSPAAPTSAALPVKQTQLLRPALNCPASISVARGFDVQAALQTCTRQRSEEAWDARTHVTSPPQTTQSHP